MTADNKPTHHTPVNKDDEKTPLLLRIRMSWVLITILAYITLHMAFMLLTN